MDPLLFFFAALLPEKKRCPRCKELISKEATKCPKCQSDLSQQQEQAVNQNQE